jgi:DNA polymerase-3 subunit epsilon
MRNWLDRLLRRDSSARAPDGPTRWVVIDLETSGLDPGSDRVLAVGAVAVHANRDSARIVLRDSLELTVAQPSVSDRQNILVHGIGEAAQRNGVAAEQVGKAVLDYVGDSPLVAFHASFDRGFLVRALKGWNRVSLGNAWLDAAELAPALHSDVPGRTLDDWLARFSITVDQRHNACADALATAMLFVRLLSDVPRAERDLRGLQRLAAHARWLPRA